ncbi:MAG: GGDEF domain-containing protein [Ruminococcus sp.]|nr:GGDEF domain-containing protein [Ruminococcus sp.]
MNSKENEQKNLLILVVCIIINILTYILARGVIAPQIFRPFSGVLAQIGLSCSVIAVLTNKKRGFVSFMVVWGIVIGSTLIGLISSSFNLALLPSIGLAVLSIIIDYIIYSNILQSDTMQKELNVQNSKLMESNKLMEEKDESLRILAYKDQLTGMNNKTYFCEQIDEAIKQKKPFTVVYSDLDNFKGINDSFGPEIGDSVVLAYAERFSSFCGNKYPCARTSGDDFALLITGEHSESELTNIIEQLRSTMTSPMNIRGRALAITASYGVASYSNAGGDTATLLNNAIISVYRAKAGGKNRINFYSNS